MTTNLAKRYQDQIRKLSRQPENIECCNCQKQNPNYVCMQYASFICEDCASVHRNFGHSGIKGISVTNFTKQDLQVLEAGGNQVAHQMFFPPGFNSKDKPDPSKPNYTKNLSAFMQQIYVDKKYTTKQKTEEFEERKRKSSITRHDSISSKETPKNLNMDLNETMTNQEIVNKSGRSSSIVNSTVERKLIGEMEPPRKTSSSTDKSLLDFFEHPPQVVQQPVQQKQSVQQAPLPTQPVKKGLNLDDLFGSNTTVPQNKPNQDFWGQPTVTKTQSFQQPTQQTYVQPQIQQAPKNDFWSQPQPQKQALPQNEFWSQPKQTMPQQTQQSDFWNQPKTSVPVFQQQAPKQVSSNPFDEFDNFGSNKVSSNPFDDFDKMVAPKQNVAPVQPKSTPIQAPVVTQNGHVPPPQPVVKKNDPFEGFHHEAPKVVPQQPKPVVPKLQGVGDTTTKVAPKQNAPNQVQNGFSQSDDFGFKMTSPKGEQKKIAPNQLNQSVHMGGDKSKGDKTDAILEQISKNESDNFAWENNFIGKDTKTIDSLRGEARRDPFESQFKEITPQKVTPFSSKTVWEK